MAVNIGNGENESEKEKCAMAENLNNFRKNDKKPTRKIERPITCEEAAELLASAIAYCNQAGFVVTGGNHGLSLRLQIDGLNYEDNKFVVTPSKVTTNQDVTTIKNPSEKMSVTTKEEEDVTT